MSKPAFAPATAAVPMAAMAAPVAFSPATSAPPATWPILLSAACSLSLLPALSWASSPSFPMASAACSAPSPAPSSAFSSSLSASSVAPIWVFVVFIWVVALASWVRSFCTSVLFSSYLPRACSNAWRMPSTFCFCCS